VNVEHLTTLEIKNLPAKILSYEQLKKAKKMVEFDAAGTFLGSPKIDTFSQMVSLTKLNLSSTGLSHIEFGMFTHQKSVTHLDISENQLGSIDINMLASMKGLEYLSISGNNLTNLDHIETFSKVFPDFEEIWIERNLWNCTYLAKLIKIFAENSVTVAPPKKTITDTPNVIGIGCVTAAQSSIQPVDVDKANEALSSKLNEIIAQINADKISRNSHKFDLDTINSEMFSIQKEILDIKTKMIMSVGRAGASEKKSNSSIDMDVFKKMMEELNNLTLEKQKLANDQLLVKINELQNQITKGNIEHDNFVNKKQLPELISKSETQRYEKSENAHQSDAKTAEILLTIVITSLVIVGVVFAYTKLKQTIYRESNLWSVRARSTNTINTTVELPFGEADK
jgi:Leucine-rich repeat (LRR) protein